MKTSTSAFLKLEGNTVKNRLWNFLIINSEFDYSMKDIASFSEVSYTALKEIWKEFVKRNIVTHTRDVGKAKMYILNRENPQVEKFINYYWSVVDSAIGKQLGAKEEMMISPSILVKKEVDHLETSIKEARGLSRKRLLKNAL